MKEEARELAAKKAYQKLVENDKNSFTSGMKVTTDVKVIHERIFKVWYQLLYLFLNKLQMKGGGCTEDDVGLCNMNSLYFERSRLYQGI